MDIIIEADNLPLLIKDMIETVQHLNRMAPPNQRLVIVIGADHLLRSMIAVWGKIAPKATEKIHFLDTLDEALAFIESYRSRSPIAQVALSCASSGFVALRPQSVYCETNLPHP